MRFAYTDLRKDKHDLIQLLAKNLDLRLYFKAEAQVYFGTISNILSKYAIKNSLLKEFRIKKPLGKGGFATV